MRKLLFTALLPLAFVIAAQGQRPTPAPDRLAVTFLQDNKRMPDDAWQSELRSRPAWQHFLQAHGQWIVEFNEGNGKPHRAFGTPIPTMGATPGERAMNFITEQLGEFGVPVNELSVHHVSTSGKYHYVHITQLHGGLPVLFSNVYVKMDLQGNVITFGVDVYDHIALSMSAGIGADQAMQAASAQLTGIVSTAADPVMRILPVPVYRGIEHHLVYEVKIATSDAGLPGKWTCWVDANNGTLLYRSNAVRTENIDDSGAEVTATSTVSAQNTLVAPTAQNMRNLHFTVGGQPFVTDANGFASSGINGPVSYNMPLSGSWSAVNTNGATPTLTGTLQQGANSVSFDAISTLEERSAYFHVNNIHDHCKDVLPTFTGMDFTLPTNVDLTAGNCNAFYDGASINFYAEANNCWSMTLISDVPYHEYGHGINDHFYQDNGSTFINGSMGEGYADVWALSLTLNPILAPGYLISDPNSYIRRYDINKKVYPSDLTGEVHANGEIIAGAWWDTYLLLGSDMTHTMQLFAEAYLGLQAEAADGDEGNAYRQVLLDVLNADDDDSNLLNGTPNGAAIAEAFRIHGITLLSGFDVTHTPVESAVQGQGIVINATAVVTFPFSQYLQGVALNYRINTGAWQQLVMTNTGGNNYSGTIPAQPVGTVIGYYIGLLDVNNIISSVKPSGAELADPNIPYFILVGYDLKLMEDADNVNQLGDWHTGMAGDNNTTGTWELSIPIGSYGTPGDPTTICQTDSDHTPDPGEYCFVTGNATSTTDGLGTNDVDAGRTTLQSDAIDLSAYTNPTFTVQRWYTNNPPSGANPGQDWWQVQVTNNGLTWHTVENTRTGDRSWRRMAFRVQDVLPLNSPVTIRFIASDSTHIGQYLDGGSLVEAAVDDIQLWDNKSGDGIEEATQVHITALYPDPADDVLNIAMDIASSGNVIVDVIDPSGRVVLSRSIGAMGHGTRAKLDVSSLCAGGYVLHARWSGGSAQQRFNVVR